jgi:uncharacterized protein YndB with AHSA1/START domain
MISDTITRDIVINASPETVYDVVSQAQHIANWFSDGAELLPVAGSQGVLTFRIGDRRDEPSVIEVTVVSADRPHLFAFSWISPERQRATPHATDAVLVEFRITADPAGTRLVVSESGLDAVDWDEEAKAAYATEHYEGWEFFLTRLRGYAEGLVTQGSA